MTKQSQEPAQEAAQEQPTNTDKALTAPFVGLSASPRNHLRVGAGTPSAITNTDSAQRVAELKQEVKKGEGKTS